MELKIQSERVLAAAAKCKAAEETLKTLFPEVFLFSPVPYGVFKVKKRDDPSAIVRYAIANPEMLRGFEKAFNWAIGLNYVVVVLMESFEKDGKPNGFSYSNWKDFHEGWKLC